MNRTYLKWISAVAGVMGLVLIWTLREPRREPPPPSTPAANITEATTSAWASLAPNPHRSVGTAPSASQAPVIDDAAIRDVLKNIQRDADGNIIVDAQVLRMLRAGFNQLGTASEEQIIHVLTSVRANLPPPAGDQAVRIIEDYQRYQAAVRSLPNPDDGNLDAAQSQLDKLISLRRTYFGEQTAEQLFGDEQAYERFAIAMMQLETNTTLSAEQKGLRATQLRGTLPERMREATATATATENSATTSPAADPNWTERYREYQRQKQIILAAGLTDEDKNAQLDRLLRDHFSPEEFEQALRYDSDTSAVAR